MTKAKVVAMPTPDIPAQLRQALDEIGEEFFERREDAEGLMITILAGGNAYLLGERGIAKSALCRRIARVFDGAVFFERLLHRNLPLEELFGMWDMPAYEQHNIWQRRGDGKMQNAHVVFLDETGKAGPTVLNPVLTWAVDGLYEDPYTGQMVKTPKVSLIGASNEVLEDELSAMWDRFDFRKKMRPLQDPANILRLFDSDDVDPPENVTTITIDDLFVAQRLVREVIVPPIIKETLVGLKASLAAEGIVPTDRRWKRLIRFLKAAAFLQGRSVVDEDDLVIAQYILWETASQIQPVEQKVLALASEFTRKAVNVQTWVAQTVLAIDALNGQPASDRGRAAQDFQYEAKQQRLALDKLIAEAQQEGRSTAKLKTALDEMQHLRMKIYVELLGTPEDRAMKIIAAEDGLDG